MKILQKKHIIWLTGLGAISTLVLSGIAQNTSNGFQDSLSIDASPPLRTGPLGGYAEVVEGVAPGVVSIYTSKNIGRHNDPYMELFNQLFGDGRSRQGAQTPAQQGLGSGVIVTKDGYIVTNNHVIEGADEINVRLPDTNKEYKAKLVGRDKGTDLAVLKIEDTDLPAVTLADSSLLKVGDTVLAIGTPFGLSATVTTGIVSALGRDSLNITKGGYENFIQTDASINPGNSGGALIDNKGRLIGINTAILSRSGGNVGIGFAIPINMVVDIIDQIVDNGKISRGFLGVGLDDMTPQLARALGVAPSGAVIKEVFAGTAAAEGGIEPGDVVVGVNGNAIASSTQLRLKIGQVRPGTKMEFDLLRDGQSKKVSLTIGSRDQANNRLASKQPGMRAQRPVNQGFIEGVVIDSLNQQTRNVFNIPGEVNGAVVTNVDPNSNAAAAGLKPGDVIIQVGRQRISSPAEAAQARANAAHGDVTLLRVVGASGTRFIAISN